MPRLSPARWVKLLMFTALGLGAAACVGPTFILQDYPGPVQSAERVAIVRFEGNAAVDLVAVDGNVADAHVPDDARLHLELLPGKHLLAVANRAAPNDPPLAVRFNAEPGRFYKVVFAANQGDFAVRRALIFEIDQGSGALLKDVTSERAAPPSRAPVAASASVAPVPAPPSEPARSLPSVPPQAPLPSASSGASAPFPAPSPAPLPTTDSAPKPAPSGSAAPAAPSAPAASVPFPSAP